MTSLTGVAGVASPGANLGESPRLRGGVAGASRSLIRRPGVLVSLSWLVLVVVASSLAGVLATHDPQAQDLTHRLSAPSGTYWLGTDDLGRDLLSRILHGGGQLLVAALVPVGVAMLIGVPLGLLVGYVGGLADNIADFVVNVLLSIPGLVIVLAVAVISNQNLVVMTFSMGVIVSGGVLRLVRATTRASRDLLYVDAARVSGVSRATILGRHILPNVLGPLIVQGFLLYSGAFLFLCSLSFLGLGFNPAQPSWGQLVFDASQELYDDPWMMVPIGVVLIATVAAINALASAVLTTLPSAKRTRLLPPNRRPLIPAPDTARNPTYPPPYASTAPPTDLSRQPTSAPALAVRDLRVDFPVAGGLTQTVVSGVSFDVEAGQTLCLVGESGSGKTMTALALMGLLPEGGRVGGSVRLEGRELLGLSENELSAIRGGQIALISQEPLVALDPCFSVASQLGQAIRLRRASSRKQAAGRALELLRLVGIANPEQVARSYPHQLSGGMAQRVCIAIVLAGEPAVLVADEPTTALDPSIQAEILDLLRSLQASLGLAIVLVTHDLGVVAEVGDSAAVMYAGQVVEDGPTAELLVRPQHPYTQGLLDSMPERGVHGEPLRSVPGVVPLPRDWPSHCRFAARCPMAIDECRAGEVPLTRVSSAHASRCIRTDRMTDTANRATP